MAFSVYKILRGLLISQEGTTTPKEIEITPGGTAGTKTSIVSSQTANRTITLPDTTDTLVPATDLSNHLADTSTHGITSAIVGTSETQTLSNKTLDNTTVATIKDSSLTIQDNTDTTKQLKFEVSGITTGTTRTLTAPDANTTLVGTDTTQTLTNKTLTSPTLTTPDIGAATGTSVAVTGNITSSGGVMGVGTASPASSSILDLTSTTKGLLIPRMTTTQRDNISSPATGLEIYNTTTNKVNFYNGSAWNDIAGVSTSDLADTSNASLGDALVGFKQTLTGSVGSTVHSKLLELISIKDFGATGDGSTNDNAALSAALSGIGVNNYRLSINYPIKFSGNLTFPSNVQLEFYNNGKLIGTTGSETVTINGPLIAPVKEIFSTCSPVFGYGTTVYPEWFGAVGDGSTDDYSAINKAVASLASVRGVVLFGPKTYKMGTVVTITSSNLILRGAGNWATRILTTGASQSAFQFTGTDSTTKINHNGVEDMFIYKSVTATGGVGILLNYTSVASIKNVQIADFGYGIQLYNATNTLISNVTCSNSAGTFNFVGFYIDGTDPAGNVSSKFVDCTVDAAGNTGTSVGFYNVSTAAGGNINDVYFENCATASCYSGYKIDGSNQLSNAWGDIMITNPIVDYYTDYGILIANMPTGSGVTIQGGWIDAKPVVTDTIGIYIYQSSGVTIDSTQFWCDPTTARNTYGIDLDTSSDTSIRGCLFYDHKYGVYGTASSYCSLVGNKFYSANGFTTSHIHLTSTSSYFTITSNTLNGYGTNGILFDTLTTANKAFNNSINNSLITNTLVDNNPSSNNQFSIGNGIASAPLTLGKTTNGTNTAAITGTKVHLMALDSVTNIYFADAFGTSNQLIGRRAQGTSASPTTLVNTAIILRLGGQGRDDTGYNSNTAVSVDMLAEGTWSTTSLPTGISFKTTASSSTTLTERMRISNAGNVGIGKTPATLLDVNGPMALAAPSTINSATYSLVSTDSSLIITTTNCTITLQSAASFPGRILYVKNISANSLVSASSNVVPLAGGAAGTAILSASAGKFAMLQSDGTNWQIMMAN